MKKHPLPNAADDSDRKLLSDIARVGWHLVGIPEDERGPGYVFTVGLYHSFDQPEIILLGLDIAVAGQLINDVGYQMERGRQFKECDIVDDVADGLPLAFRSVAEEYYQSYLGYGLWFYESRDFPVLQLVWPDRNSNFPWDANCDRQCRELQQLHFVE